MAGRDGGNGPSADASALARLRRYLSAGPDLAWDAPSRYRGAGMLARRVLQRSIKPYAVRQRQFAELVVEALDDIDRRLAPSAPGSTPAPEAPAPVSRRLAALATPMQADAVVEAETDVGTLWLSAPDRLLTRVVREHGMWEPEVGALLRRLLAPGMTYVDVGANIGYFAVLAAGLVGPGGRVVAFEPDPVNLPPLRANLWRHLCANAEVWPVAAHSRHGHLPLVSNPEGGSGSYVEPTAEAQVLVPCLRLDDALLGTAVDVLKVDVEGRDPEVIAGALALLRTNPDATVIVEVWSDANLDGVLGRYEDMGFRLFQIGGDGHLRAATRQDVLEAGKELTYMNIVLRSEAAPDPTRA